MRKEENLLGLVDSEGVPRCSGAFRSLQRPVLRQFARLTAVELGRVWRCEEEDEDEDARGEMKRTLSPIYKAVDRWHARESRRLKMIM